MTVFFWVTTVLLVAGAAVGSIGLVRYLRDGRRLSALVSVVAGALTALVSAGFLGLQQGNGSLLLATAFVGVAILVLGNLVGYPLLTIFLLWSGFTVLRRENRSLGNALALLAGIGMLLLPLTLRALEPSTTVRDDAGYIAQYAVHLAATLVVAYLAFCFGAFVSASFLYRWRRIRPHPEAIIVLGSGLVKGEVPPLLAGRLAKGMRVQQRLANHPVIIASGGQGPDEPRSEGAAMREHLIGQGVDPASVVAETESRNTLENLELSRKLLADPQSPVLVVTSNYHVFRAAMLTRRLGMRAHVLGAKTVWYFVPSAFLREFAAVMRDHLRLHAAAVALIVVLAVVSSILLVPVLAPPGA